MSKTENKSRGRPSKPVHVLSDDFDITENSKYVELYYSEEEKKPVSLAVIENRIKKADTNINSSIIQTALDIYFVRMNWKTLYSKDSSEKKRTFNEWLEKSVPLSRSYAFDLFKIVRELITYKTGETPKEIDDVLVVLARNLITTYGVTLCREIIHSPEEIKTNFLKKIEEGDNITVNDVKIAKQNRPKSPKQRVYVIDDELKDGKDILLTLKNINDGNLRDKLANAVERVYSSYIKNQQK